MLTPPRPLGSSENPGFRFEAASLPILLSETKLASRTNPQSITNLIKMALFVTVCSVLRSSPKVVSNRYLDTAVSREPTSGGHFAHVPFRFEVPARRTFTGRLPAHYDCSTPSRRVPPSPLSLTRHEGILTIQVPSGSVKFRGQREVPAMRGRFCAEFASGSRAPQSGLIAAQLAAGSGLAVPRQVL